MRVKAVGGDGEGLPFNVILRVDTAGGVEAGSVEGKTPSATFSHKNDGPPTVGILSITPSIFCTRGGGGGVTGVYAHTMHDRHCMSINHRISTMPGRSTSGFHRPV